MTTDEIRLEDDKLIVNDVARAVEERELLAYYQPVVDLETQRVVGAEALVRWTMPDGTIVPAGLFVPSLDRTDTIYGLDWFMAEDTCAFLSDHADQPAFVPISLNFSARHANTKGFAQNLVATAEWRNVPLDHVRMELGESIVLAGDEAIDALVDSVIAAGVSVVVDKYSRGIEGLDALERRGISFVKVARAWWSEQSVEGIRELVGVAASKGMCLSAEGVEEESEAKDLLAAGLTLAQGYYLAKPMDGDSFAKLCAEQ